MRLGFHLSQDTAAGLLFVVFGATGLYLSRGYPMGSAALMGPGYFPYLLCWLTIGFGMLVAFKGCLAPGEKMTRWHLRPLFLVAGAIGAFGLLIERAGLIAAVVACVLIATASAAQFRLREALLLAAGVAAASVAIFVYGLNLRIHALPF